MKLICNRYMKPATEGESGTAAVDRGDDFTPTPEDVDAAALGGEITPEEIEAERVKLGLPKPAAKAKEDDKEAEPAAKPAKDPHIPLSRHEAVLQKARERTEALEAKVAELERGQVKEAVSTKVAELEDKVTKLEAEYNDAMAEGETVKATALMKDIRLLERQVIEQTAEARSQMATAQAVEQVRFQSVVDRLETAYPQLNPDKPDEYDAELVAEIMELQEAYMLKGYAGSAALQRAVSKLVKPTTTKQEVATTVTPRVDSAEAVAEARKIAARKKATEAANAQPAGTQGVGTDSDSAGGLLDAAKAIKMPWEKFAKLDDETLARMRGDTL